MNKVLNFKKCKSKKFVIKIELDFHLDFFFQCWNTCETFSFWDKEEIDCTRIYKHTSHVSKKKVLIHLYLI